MLKLLKMFKLSTPSDIQSSEILGSVCEKFTQFNVNETSSKDLLNVSSSLKKEYEASSLQNGNNEEESYSETSHPSSKNFRVIFQTSSMKNTTTPPRTKNRNFLTPSLT